MSSQSLDCDFILKSSEVSLLFWEGNCIMKVELLLFPVSRNGVIISLFGDFDLHSIPSIYQFVWFFFLKEKQFDLILKQSNYTL